MNRLLRSVDRIGQQARAWSQRVNPWTNVYGLARSLLAIGTAGTLAFSHSTTLFRPAVGIPTAPICQGLGEASFFCLFPKGHLELARWLAVVILLVVTSGWRPRLTGILHWWIAASYMYSAVVQDGGDQITSILAFLLLPVTLTDRRQWHWQVATDRPPEGREVLLRLLALSAFTVIRLQVAGVYLHTSVAKFEVPEWVNGTVLYYWLTDPSFGVAPWLRPVVLPLVMNGLTVTLMTYGTLVLELGLFTGLVMPKGWWPYMLLLGIAFHTAIGVMMGLVSFSIAMYAALILYLHPVEKQFWNICALPRVLQIQLLQGRKLVEAKS